MKLIDFGEDTPPRAWYTALIEWSRKKISFDDNIDCVILKVNIATNETAVDHPLGRVPKGIIPILQFPGSVYEMDMTRASTNTQVFIKMRVAGTVNLLIF